MNTLKETISHVEKLEEAHSEQERTLKKLLEAVLVLKEQMGELAKASSSLEGKESPIPKMLFQEISTSEVFCTAMNGYFEGHMRAFPQLRKEEEYLKEVQNDAITHGLRAVLTLKARAESA